MLLAIDTSTHISSIALNDARGVLGEISWQSHQNHTRNLMPETVRLMELVGANVNGVRAVGVAIGPGSFTGLRIGLSAAKGFAFSLNVALIGIPTLDITAGAFAHQPMPVCAILQVGRGRYGAAMYENKNGAARRVTDYMFGGGEKLAADLQTVLRTSNAVLVAGEVDENFRVALANYSDHSYLFANAGMNLRRAGILGTLAWQRWEAGDADDLQTLAPFYIPTASLS